MKLSKIIEAMAESGIDAVKIAAICKRLEASQAETRKARNQRYRETQKTSQDAKDAKGSDGSNDNITLTSLPPKLSSLRSDKTRAREQPLEILKSVLSDQTAQDVIAHRKAKRAPLTPRAAELLAAAFRDHGDAEAAAEAMIIHGWQGFKSEWLNDGHPRPPPRNGVTPGGRSNGIRGFFELTNRMIADEVAKRSNGGNGHERGQESFPGLPELR